jgi:hypothetical protein
MSQIGSAYIITSDLADRLGKEIAAKDYDGFWSLIHSRAVEIKPRYSYSGYVLVALASYLHEIGVRLPLNLGCQGLQAIDQDQEFSFFLCCAGIDDKSSALIQLASLNAHPGRLKDYYENLVEEQWEEAGLAMLKGIDFIKRGLARLQRNDEWFIVHVG